MMMSMHLIFQSKVAKGKIKQIPKDFGNAIHKKIHNKFVWCENQAAIGNRIDLAFMWELCESFWQISCFKLCFVLSVVAAWIVSSARSEQQEQKRMTIRNTILRRFYVNILKALN